MERLNEARCTGGSIDNHMMEYLNELGAVFYSKLVKVDLVEPRTAEAADELPEPELEVQLGKFLTDYLARRTDIKASSKLVYGHVQRDLLRYFKANMPIADITHGHVVDLGRHLKKRKLARPTIDRRISLARTMFADAVNHRLLDSNPFDGFRKSLKGIVSRNTKSRQHTVSQDIISSVLEHCPDAEWRCLIALSRFGGLRVPSEALSLRWSDIDWNRNIIHVPCPKLEHLEEHAVREVPLFGELLPYLLECSEAADDGAEFVISRHRPPALKSGAGWANANLRTRFEKIIRKAGQEPWPRLWHNLRASRQTELADEFPSHVVCAWLGNSESVAREHYLKVTPEHIQRAIKCNPLSRVMPQVMPHREAKDSTDPQGSDRVAVKDCRNSSPCKKKRPHAETCDRSEMEDRGLEPLTFWLPARRSPN